MASSTLYEAASGLLLKSWGEASDIVFLPRAGTTHLVGAQAGEWMQRLLSGPLSAADLAPTGDEQQVSQGLDALVRAGLIYPRPAP